MPENINKGQNQTKNPNSNPADPGKVATDRDEYKRGVPMPDEAGTQGKKDLGEEQRQGKFNRDNLKE